MKSHCTMLEEYGCSLHGTLEEGNCRLSRPGKANIYCQGQTMGLSEYVEVIHGYYREKEKEGKEEGFEVWMGV